MNFKTTVGDITFAGKSLRRQRVSTYPRAFILTITHLVTKLAKKCY